MLIKLSLMDNPKAFKKQPLKTPESHQSLLACPKSMLSGNSHCFYENLKKRENNMYK